LDHHAAEIDRPAKKTRWGSRFHPAKGKAAFVRKDEGKTRGGAFPSPASLCGFEADVEFSVEKGPGSKNQGAAGEAGSVMEDHLGHRAVCDDQINDLSLPKEEVGLGVKKASGFDAVPGPVTLGPDCLDSRTLSGIEHLELKAGPVGQLPHGSAHGIDLPDEMPLPDPSDGGIAGHLADQVQMHRDQESAQTHAGGGISGFNSCMPPSDYQNVP
jgi:hypothetical protein